MATFTFVGASKLIQVDAEAGDSAFTATDVYSAWKVWVSAGNAQWEPAFAESVGGNDLGGGVSLDAYVFLRNDLGWRIRPDARDHTLQIDGNLYGVTAAASIFTAPVSNAIVTIERSFSSRALAVDTGGGGGGGAPSANEVAAAVWAHANAATLQERVALATKILRNKTVTDPSAGTMTVYDDDGATVLLTCALYENAAGTQPYRGDGAERRERLA